MWSQRNSNINRIFITDGTNYNLYKKLSGQPIYEFYVPIDGKDYILQVMQDTRISSAYGFVSFYETAKDAAEKIEQDISIISRSKNLFHVTNKGEYIDANGAIVTNSRFDTCRLTLKNNCHYIITPQTISNNIKVFSYNEGIYTLIQTFVHETEYYYEVPAEGTYVLQTVFDHNYPEARPSPSTR